MVTDVDATLEMGRHARELAIERYDWGVVMHAMTTHIDRCLGDGHPATHG